MPATDYSSGSQILKNAQLSSSLPVDKWCPALRQPEIRLVVKKPDWLKWVEGSTENPLVRASQFVNLTGSDLPLRWACGQAGGFLVQAIPDADVQSEEALYYRWYQTSEWISQLRRAVYEAFQDDRRIDSAESRQIALLWGTAKGRIEGLVSAITRTPVPADLETNGNHSLKSHASHEIVRVALDGAAFSSKSIAEEMGVSTSLVTKWGQPSGLRLTRKNGIGGNPEYSKPSGSANPFDYVVRIVEVSGDVAPIAWLCEQAGGWFVPNPRSGLHKIEGFWPSWRALHTRMGAFDEVMGKAIWDRRIDGDESILIRENWEILKSLMEDFTDACEASYFADAA